MIVLVWIFSALISIPPLLGWKDEVDLEWFWKILNERENRTQMEFLQDIEESGRLDLNNFTQTLETVVYPQCLVSQFLIITIYHTHWSIFEKLELLFILYSSEKKCHLNYSILSDVTISFLLLGQGSTKNSIGSTAKHREAQGQKPVPPQLQKKCHIMLQIGSTGST